MKFSFRELDVKKMPQIHRLIQRNFLPQIRRLYKIGQSVNLWLKLNSSARTKAAIHKPTAE